MKLIRLTRSVSLTLFAAVAGGVYATALAIAGQMQHLERSNAVAIGLTLDLVAVVPLAFYFLVVRPWRLRLIILVPVIILSVLAAHKVLPSSHHQLLGALKVLAAPLEIGLISWVVWRAVRALRQARKDVSVDPLEQFRQVALELSGNAKVASVLASEVGVFYYALASWRACPHVPEGWVPYTHHRRSGHGGFVLAFLVILGGEGLAVHFLLLQWSLLLACIFTAGTVYAALWLVADYRATVLRPILVNAESILIRAGFRCTIQVGRGQITKVARSKPDFGKEAVNLTFLGTPTRWLILAEPMLAQGPYGFRRRVHALGIEFDAPEEFDDALDSLT